MSKQINDDAAELSREYADKLAKLYPNSEELSAALAATVGTFIAVHNVDPNEIIHDILSGIMLLVDDGTIKENPFETRIMHPGPQTLQ